MQPNPALSATKFDVKPDMKVFPGCGTGGDFMSRVKKGSKRFFIEEYPLTDSTADGGKIFKDTVKLHQPHSYARPVGEENFNTLMRGRSDIARYGNMTAHPMYPPHTQHYTHNSAMPGAIQRRVTNTRYSTWPGVTQADEVSAEVWDPRESQLCDDRPRFQNVKDRKLFFPTSPEWFHLGSRDAPLVRDVRKLAPIIEWSNQLGHEQGGMSCHAMSQHLPVVTLAAIQQPQEMHIVNTYEDAKRNSVPLWKNPPAVIQIPIQESKETQQTRPPQDNEKENLRNAAL